MKKWMIISLLITAIITITSVSYAWFTYVQRKSLVQLSSHELDAILSLNDYTLGSTLNINGLTYVDFEQEVMMNTISDGFNEVGYNYIVKMSVSDSSPIMKVMIELINNHQELIILWIDEGLLEDEMNYTTDYLSYLKTIGSNATTKQDFLFAIEENNTSVLENLSQIQLRPGDTYVLQLVIWADYNALDPEDQNLTQSYDLSLGFYMISGKGDFSD